MCQGSEFIRFKNPCICEPKINDRLLSKKELLVRLKEYKKNLESELIIVNKNLESTAAAAEGGD
jgi:hypothetical protein